ncbi:MAG: nuclear transport factor 2 family protein [Gemmatimonadetes bacterium]|nr:nuclear transport factor 2 family protein [Gemmatimonadota bacterium]
MAEHPDAVIMRRTAAAFNAGDLSTLAGLIAEDVAWHLPGRSPFAGDFRGRDATFAMFGRLMEASAGTLRVDLQQVLGGDGAAINIDRITAQRSGRRLDMRLLLLARIENGRIVEAWDHFEDQYAWDAFWA